MTQLRTIPTKAGATVAALGVAALVAACGGSAHATHSANASGSGSAATVSGTPASDRATQISISSGHLAGPGRHAIYLWEADRRNKSNCTGACAAAWPPVVSKSRPVAGSGVTRADLGTIARPGGGRQVTYHGHPLYYYAGDSGPGTTRGQGSDGFGAKWWLVSPSGAAITSHSSSGSTSQSSYGSTSGGSSGGGW